MIRQRKIELLAPAKNLECGIAAVDHGADAIYIGAPRFGARAAAGGHVHPPCGGVSRGKPWIFRPDPAAFC